MAQRKPKRRDPQARNRQKFQTIIADLSTRECILCGDPVRYVGIWTPSPELQRRVLAAPGKTRSVGYGLCQSCSEEPDPATAIEEKILAAFESANLPVDVN